MQTSKRLIVEYLGKSFDDSDYDYLLDDFIRCHRARFIKWKKTEILLFESRAVPVRGAYPDQHLMNFCEEFLKGRLIDEIGGMGPSHVWRVLRGRILRSALEDWPCLNPAPGKTLITEPRSCIDSELLDLADEFDRRNPHLWREWKRVEATNSFVDDPLREISNAFHDLVKDSCWVQSNVAVSKAFLALRILLFNPLKKSR